MSVIMPELAGKRLELLKEIIPKLSRVAHSGGAAHKLFVKEAQEAAERFGMKFWPLIINSGSPGDRRRVLSNDQGAGWRADHLAALYYRSWTGPKDCGSRSEEPLGDSLGRQSVCRGRGLDVLWARSETAVPARRYLRRQDPQRR